MLAFSVTLILAFASMGSSLDHLEGGRGVSKVKHIFLLAGQSNMSGRGGVVNETWDHFIPLESSSNSLIYRLNSTLDWVEANEPLHKDIDTKRTCGVGPGMAFANSLLQKDPSVEAVGLVPCAIGGTKISEWARGGILYNHLVRRARAALEDGGIIRGLLWYQGESDTVKWEDAYSYKRRLELLFEHLRVDLNSPLLPIIQVALASGEGPYVESVRRAQFGTRLKNVDCVDAQGLHLQPDRLHLSTSSQVHLGEMLADAFFHKAGNVFGASAPMQSANEPIPYEP